MKHMLASVSVAGMLAIGGSASAASTDIVFSGPGVSGKLMITYGPGTDEKYANGYEVTGISGMFSDSNNSLNIVNASVGPLVAINNATPEPTNLLAPNDFSRFAVANGLPDQSGGFITYDNLYWPGTAPATASDYTVHGGYLDIYGLLFNIGGGIVVDLWSNGVFAPGTPADYGVAVATADNALDYVSGGVMASPEPSTWAMLLLGFAGIGFAGYRSARRGASQAA